jgi:hypothetical protein
MSRYDWESGTLTIPTKAWKPLRDGLTKAFNAHQAQCLRAALQVHALVSEWKQTAPRGKFTVGQAMTALHDNPRHRQLFDFLDDDVYYAVKKSLCGKLDNGQLDEKKLRVPKKNDFPLAVSTKTKNYPAGCEGSIHLDHEKHELYWSTGENNHAVERARDSVMGRALFALLAKVEWTRGSGGEFVGNDEYNRESRNDGGGANYVTARYAAKTKAEKEAESRRYGAYGSRSLGYYGR